MSTSGIELREVSAQSVTISDDASSPIWRMAAQSRFHFYLIARKTECGGGVTWPKRGCRRTLCGPPWFPRLLNGTMPERFRLIGGGSGILWPDLDEDVHEDNSVASLLAGRRSGETQESVGRRLKSRARV
jgi:hypothetical protein